VAVVEPVVHLGSGVFVRCAIGHVQLGRFGCRRWVVRLKNSILICRAMCWLVAIVCRRSRSKRVDVSREEGRPWCRRKWVSSRGREQRGKSTRNSIIKYSRSVACSDYNIAGAMATRFGLHPAAAFRGTGRVSSPTRALLGYRCRQSAILANLWCSSAVSPRGRQFRVPNPIPSTSTEPGTSDFETMPFPSAKVVPGARTPGAEAVAATINLSQ